VDLILLPMGVINNFKLKSILKSSRNNNSKNITKRVTFKDLNNKIEKPSTGDNDNNNKNKNNNKNTVNNMQGLNLNKLYIIQDEKNKINLTNNEIKILSKGINFIPQSINSSFQSFQKRKTNAIDQFVKISRQISARFSNDTLGQQWLDLNIKSLNITENYLRDNDIKVKNNVNVKDLIQVLNRNDLVITTTDKNLGMAVTHIEIYKKRIFEHLNQPNYKIIEDKSQKEIADKVATDLNSLINSLITEFRSDLDIKDIKELKFCKVNPINKVFEDIELKKEIGEKLNYIENKYKKGKFLCKFYVVPKVHKNNNSIRPIISQKGWIIEKINVYISKYLLGIIEYFKQLQNNTIIVNDLDEARENLVDAINKIQETLNPNEEKIIIETFDFTSLYTKLEHEKIIFMLERTLKYCVDLNAMKPHFKKILIELIKFSINNTYANESITNINFKQIIGIPMGASCSPEIANLTLDNLEKNNFYVFKAGIKFLERYIDDLLMVRVEKFDNIMKNIDSSVSKVGFKWMKSVRDRFRLTYISMEINDAENNIESNVFVPFLDFEIYVDGKNKVITRVRIKKLSKHLLPLFDSNHSIHTFKGIVIGELLRAARICSEYID
jgi:hypothetical protein